jgi:hypothetical protein
MSAPTQLNISVAINNSGTFTTSTVVIAIPGALQALDSANSSGQGQVSQLNTTTGIWSTGQTGYSSADQLVRAIFRAGVFTDGAGKWYSANIIQTITAA